MKPKILILSGWGPYKDKVEVDFTRLDERGLFLIAGPTGAGKTTLFDAITYALYGAMSGELREKSSVRSDFADADTATFVELIMQHGGKEYRIVRNPEYLRPKKRQSKTGDYTKEKENAVLYLPDGSIIQGSSEVNRKIQDVLVLDYRQYKQISMIAQGEFARLLAASPAEKTKIFREIFSTSIYDRFAGILRTRSGELYKQVMEYKHRMEEDIHMLRVGEAKENEALSQLIAGEDYFYEKILEQLKESEHEHKKSLTVAQKQYGKLEEAAVKLTEEISASEQVNDKLHRLTREMEVARLLRERKPEIEAKKVQLKGIKAAASLSGDYVQSENEKKQLRLLVQRQKEAEEELKVLEARRHELLPLYKSREKIIAAYECRKLCIEKERFLKEIGQQRIQKEEELRKLQKEYLEKEELTSKAKEVYEMADLAYKRAAVGIAARLLQEGEPCPVCGSCEHPKVAQVSDDVPEEEKLNRLRDNYHVANRVLMEIHGKASACKGELQGRIDREKEARNQLEDHNRALQAFGEEIHSVMNHMAQTEYENLVMMYEKLQTREEEKKEVLKRTSGEILLQESSKEEAEALFEQKYREAGFSDIDMFEESLSNKGRIEPLEKEIEDYDRKIHASENLIEHLKEETKGQSEIDISKLKEQWELKRQERQEMIVMQNKWNHRLHEVEKIRKSLTDKLSHLQKLNKEYGIVKDLDNMASGNNPKRLVFEQYVLAGYFEEILRAANIRLAKMTNGRFELSRVEEVSDGRTKDNLEIQVLDYYTGKHRSVKTLSGGESFKASLALALGMSDVIQSYSGGIRVETLFIDEGFGSLDSESLDQACQTLMSLVEKDRLIGIISHVPELAEKIEKQIIITKTNIGSSIKIVV